MSVLHENAEALRVTCDPVQLVSAPKWRCDRHGDHDAVVCVFAPGAARIFCVWCVLDTLEAHGLKSLERVE